MQTCISIGTKLVIFFNVLLYVVSYEQFFSFDCSKLYLVKRLIKGRVICAADDHTIVLTFIPL